MLPLPSGRSGGDRLFQVVAGAGILPLLLITACTGDQDAVQEPQGTEGTSEVSAESGEADQDSEGSAEAEGSEQGSAEDGSSEAEDQNGSEASTDPESIHVLVNRSNPLGQWAPEDLTVPEVPAMQDGIELRQEAATALEEMFSAAQSDGVELALTSGYRSYDYQIQVYGEAYGRLGEEGADEYYARPGYSEHQSGLAADVHTPDREDCILSTCFGDTEAGRWVAEHAAEHGFIIRYPEGAEDITGYQYEPWHLRYLGQETAEAVAATGGTLEEYWDAEPAGEYPADAAIPGIEG